MSDQSGIEFDGLKAIVTGGASGIGLATAKILAERGAEVAVLDLQPDAVREPFVAITTDVSSTASVNEAVTTAAGALGGIDIVVNNAGIGAIGSVEAFDEAEWRRVLEVNLLGMARVTAASLPWLRKSEHASVVNVGSIAARVGLPDRALYSASKGAVVALSLAMAADHVREGVRVNCVCPGTAGTPWIQRLLAQADDPEHELAALNARQPIGRVLYPEEVAEAIVHLASPRAAATTGAIFDVDGGVTRLRIRPTES